MAEHNRVSTIMKSSWQLASQVEIIKKQAEPALVHEQIFVEVVLLGVSL